MSGLSRAYESTRAVPGATDARRRRRRRLLVVLGPAVAVALGWVVLFALYSGAIPAPSTSGSTTASGGRLNPGNVPVVDVRGVLVANNASVHAITFAGGPNLCIHCPRVPVTDATLNPPGARLTLFFNLSNSGSIAYTFGNLSVSSQGGTAPNPFSVYGVLCCAPNYADQTGSGSILPGSTIGLAVVLSAPMIPPSAQPGYHLILEVDYAPT